MPKSDGCYEPKVGQLLSFKLVPGDEDIADWLTAKQLKPGTVGQFFRDLIRREIQREANGIPGDLDGLAAKLADRLRPYMSGGMPMPADDQLGREVKEALELNEAADDLLADIGISLVLE